MNKFEKMGQSYAQMEQIRESVKPETSSRSDATVSLALRSFVLFAEDVSSASSIVAAFKSFSAF